MKAREPIDAVTVEEGDRRVAELCRAIDERLRERGALQKAEGRGCMKLDVGHDAEIRSRLNSRLNAQRG